MVKNCFKKTNRGRNSDRNRKTNRKTKKQNKKPNEQNKNEYTTSSSDTDEYSKSNNDSNLKWLNEIKIEIDYEIQQLFKYYLITETYGLDYCIEFINLLCVKNIVLSDNKITLLSQKLELNEFEIRKILSDHNQ